MDLVNEIKNGSKRAAARLISMIENQDAEAAEILKKCGSSHTKSQVIGITGPPGSGKSTLTDQLAKVLLKDKKKVGIIAVDPSSSITGGAFLGDRVRMSDLNGEPDVFIRSMGTRGVLGGLSKAVRGAIRVLETFGMDCIFIETVGIGQSEVDIAGVADTVVLVTVPGMGDDIQAEKAGILEVADVIAVNKADHEGLNQTIQHLRSLILRSGASNIQIVSTIAVTGFGIEELMASINSHYHQLLHSGKADKKEKERLESELTGLILSKFKEQFKEYDKQRNATEKCVTAILRSGSNPYSEADLLFQDFMKWKSSHAEED